MGDTRKICCLCGNFGTDDDPITREHVLAKQFYPESMRPGLNLWTVPSHRSCNQKIKLDEEYFYHVLYPLVANANPEMGKVILSDLERRAKEPQTRTLIRSILNTERNTTDGGIVLPPGVVRLDADWHRLQEVAIKVGRCLFYRDHKRYMPYENCKDIRLCERMEDVPEFYRLSWELSKVNVHDLEPSEPGGIIVVADAEGNQPAAACRQVFSYLTAHVRERSLHLYTTVYWEAFAFCMAFEDAEPTS